MAMERLTRKDILEIEDFTKKGDTFIKIRENRDLKRVAWKRTSPQGRISYEVWIGIKYTNPDGSIVYGAPSTEHWGKYGFTVDNNRMAEDLIDFLLTSEDVSITARREFKTNWVKNNTGNQLLKFLFEEL